MGGILTNCTPYILEPDNKTADSELQDCSGKFSEIWSNAMGQSLLVDWAARVVSVFVFVFVFQFWGSWLSKCGRLWMPWRGVGHSWGVPSLPMLSHLLTCHCLTIIFITFPTVISTPFKLPPRREQPTYISYVRFNVIVFVNTPRKVQSTMMPESWLNVTVERSLCK